MYPSYLNLYKTGELGRKIKQALKLMETCFLCPRGCKANRLKNEQGYCKTGRKAKIYSFAAHSGEEPPISGTAGSGTIFFARCSMSCVYCQNYEFSQKEGGREADAGELARCMLSLQKIGCHNINLVTPTHVMPQILEALPIAISAGLNIPLVYNTGGYELPEVIKLLEGIVDIYLPDMRYSGEKEAIELSSAPGYPENNRASVKEMHRQVGVARFEDSGTIRSGLIIRHLVLPESLSGTESTMRFIAEKLSLETYISLMSQYAPYHLAPRHPQINRKLYEEEYAEAKRLMESCGLFNGWVQESGDLETFAGKNLKANFKGRGRLRPGRFP